MSKNAIEGIRCRPAMYIGAVGSHGLHYVIQELIHDRVGKFLEGRLSSIHLHIHRNGSLTIGDDGIGISLEKYNDRDPSTTFEAHFLDRVKSKPWFSKQDVGWCGILIDAAIVTNALSEWLLATNFRDGFVWTLGFRQGKLASPLKRRRATDSTGLSITFKPDAEIFEDATFDYDRIRRRMWELSFLVPGITLCLRDDRTSQEETFYQPKGIQAFVEHLNQQADILFPEVFTHEVEFEAARIGVAFQPTVGFEPQVRSFVNSEACNEGTHIKGFRAGLWRALDHYGKTHGLFLHQVPRIEHYYEGMTAVISVWLEDPMYEGPARFKLGNVEMANTVAKVVREGIEHWAIKQPECIHQLIEKAAAAAERGMS